MILGRYFSLGLALTFGGAGTAFASFLSDHYIPLVALGIATVIVGLTAISLPDQVKTSEAMKLLLKGSTTGIDPLLDEIRARTEKKIPNFLASTPNVSNMATSPEDTESQSQHSRIQTKSNFVSIYLPPKRIENIAADGGRAFSSSPPASGEDGKSSVYIPLGNRYPSTLSEMWQASTTLLPPERAQTGIRVFTSGAYLGELLQELAGEHKSIEEALHHVLIESADLCSSVRASVEADAVVVEMKDIKVEQESDSYRALLGTLPTSLAASVVSTLEQAPVVVVEERVTATRTVARLVVLSIH